MQSMVLLRFVSNAVINAVHRRVEAELLYDTLSDVDSGHGAWRS